MDKKRLEIKVGVFVLVGLVLLGALAVQFSKGMSLFRPTYRILLRAPNVGGLKLHASVLMSGVQVGTVSDVLLASDGKSVTITLTIYQQFRIYRDAEFRIQQAGFLGDQYVSVRPTKNEGDWFHGGELAQTEEPFDLQEVARSASGFIRRIDDTARRLNAAIDDIRRLALNEQTLSNLAATIGTMRQASERAVVMVDDINRIFATNGPAIELAASNLVAFSEDMARFADRLNSVLQTNADEFSVAVKNVQSSTASIDLILKDVQAGKGTAGTLLHNEQVASDVTAIVNNLSLSTSNLNRLGFWRWMWHRETPPRTNAPPSRPSRQTEPRY